MQTQPHGVSTWRGLMELMDSMPSMGEDASITALKEYLTPVVCQWELCQILFRSFPFLRCVGWTRKGLNWLAQVHQQQERQHKNNTAINLIHQQLQPNQSCQAAKLRLWPNNSKNLGKKLQQSFPRLREKKTSLVGSWVTIFTGIRREVRAPARTKDKTSVTSRIASMSVGHRDSAYARAKQMPYFLGGVAQAGTGELTPYFDHPTPSMWAFANFVLDHFCTKKACTVSCTFCESSLWRPCCYHSPNFRHFWSQSGASVHMAPMPGFSRQGGLRSTRLNKNASFTAMGRTFTGMSISKVNAVFLQTSRAFWNQRTNANHPLNKSPTITPSINPALVWEGSCM